MQVQVSGLLSDACQLKLKVSFALLGFIALLMNEYLANASLLLVFFLLVTVGSIWASFRYAALSLSESLLCVV